MTDNPGLFTYRKQGALPSGEKITLLKVGGRTSAVVPSLQKKTGAVAGEIDSQNTVPIADEDKNEKPNKKVKKETIASPGKKRKAEESISKPTKKDSSVKLEKKENVKPSSDRRRRSGRVTNNN